MLEVLKIQLPRTGLTVALQRVLLNIVFATLGHSCFIYAAVC